MILFLSESFLRRLSLEWKPKVTGFLVGHRNMFFFYPEAFVQAEEITAETIDLFLQKAQTGDWELLGFLSSEAPPAFPGYISVVTSEAFDASTWSAQLHLMNDHSVETRTLPIRTRA